jgi:hypothetical protein
MSRAAASASAATSAALPANTARARSGSQVSAVRLSGSAADVAASTTCADGIHEPRPAASARSAAASDSVATSTRQRRNRHASRAPAKNETSG